MDSRFEVVFPRLSLFVPGDGIPSWRGPNDLTNEERCSN